MTTKLLEKISKSLIRAFSKINKSAALSSSNQAQPSVTDNKNKRLDRYLNKSFQLEDRIQQINDKYRAIVGLLEWKHMNELDRAFKTRDFAVVAKTYEQHKREIEHIRDAHEKEIEQLYPKNKNLGINFGAFNKLLGNAIGMPIGDDIGLRTYMRNYGDTLKMLMETYPMIPEAELPRTRAQSDLIKAIYNTVPVASSLGSVNFSGALGGFPPLPPAFYGSPKDELIYPNLDREDPSIYFHNQALPNDWARAAVLLGMGENIPYWLRESLRGPRPRREPLLEIRPDGSLVLPYDTPITGHEDLLKPSKVKPPTNNNKK
jgi:hypothetical protein